MKRTIYTLQALIIFMISAASAQNAAIDDYIRSVMQKEKIPGLSLAIVKNGEIVESKGYGMANLEHQVPARPETVYQSGSVGKQFTSMAVMMLVEQGKIRLDDPITRYFPSAPKAWQDIRVQHLLTHTSGIPDYT